MNLRNIMFGLCLVALTACGKRLEGSMKVTSAIKVYTKNGEVNLPAGTYNTVVKASSKAATVEMQTQKQKVSFTLPAISELKNKWGEGRVYFKGSQIGQSFDVDLNLDVTSSDSQLTSRSVSCVYDVRHYQEWVCRNRERRVCNDAGECRTSEYRDCGYENRSENIYGRQNETGYYNTMRRSGTFKLIRSGKTVAYLVDDKQARTNWIVTSTGRCRR